MRSFGMAAPDLAVDPWLTLNKQEPWIAWSINVIPPDDFHTFSR
jgi:hypothetical protein